MKKESIAIYKKWWFWTIIGIVIIAIYMCMCLSYQKNKTVSIKDEGISLSEFNAIEVGKTDILALKGLIGYTDKNFDKIVSEVEEPIYEKDENGSTHVFYKQKYVGENGNGYAIITIEGYLNEYTVIEKENFGLK